MGNGTEEEMYEETESEEEVKIWKLLLPVDGHHLLEPLRIW